MAAVRFDNDGDLSFRFVSWQEIGDATYTLAGRIQEKYGNFDRVVVLATGGLTFSRAFADYMGIKKISSIQVSFYSSIGETKETPIITQSLPINVEGERILLFDDINDSGRTLEAAANYLKLRGAKSIVTATIFQKAHSKNPSDFHVEETDSWVIFPFEIRETIEELSKRWQAQGLTTNKVRARFLQIGMKEDQIDFYMNQIK